ncbi:MAG: peptide ABC transporter substrate-binding protein, partial [Lachnospiraceae bacterium]|nr:peptide ABC transporter substrate-binding protein [Lachnospiraceae bacterium]
MKRLVALLLAGTMMFSLAACGDSAKDSGNAGADSSAEATTDGGSASGDAELNVCLASEPATLDPALNSAVDGGTVVLHLFSGLTKWEKKGDGLEIVHDGIKDEQKTENSDGTVTYTYTLRDDMKWSDGEPVTAGDYVFSWNRAAGPELSADYNYMFDVVKGYEEMWESKDSGEVDEDGNPVPEFVNPDAKLAVEATDDTTLVVTLNVDVPYWEELMAFPAYLPVREDVVDNDGAWAADPSTYVCNGPYTMTGWEHNSVINLTKNENFYDKDSVTMPKLNFYLSDDQNNMLTNYQNGDWQMIDEVPVNEISALQQSYPDEFFNEGQVGTYYVCWNINEDILPEGSGLSGVEAERAREEIREAITLLIDRQDIIDTAAQGGQIPASSFVAMGITDADSSQQFYENANKEAGNSYIGYFDPSSEAIQSNYDKAMETLKKYYEFDGTKLTNFPAVTYLYNTSEGHKAIGEKIQNSLANVGINMKMENQEWNTFLETR